MMSSNRSDYGSASEWLSALKHDDAWLILQQRLQGSDTGDMNIHRDDAMRRIGRGLAFEYWDLYGHQVEPAVNEVWDMAELSLPKLKIQTIGMLSVEWLEQHAHDGHDVPEKLKTKEAGEVMRKLVDAGLLSDDWQPRNLSGTERGLLAKKVCELLDINQVWQVFSELWNENSESLRAAYNKAMGQKKSLSFQDLLKKSLN